jgi:hypothetical protein
MDALPGAGNRAGNFGSSHLQQYAPLMVFGSGPDAKKISHLYISITAKMA